MTKSRRLAFPGLFPPEGDDAFARFCSALKEGRCHNPWPELFDPEKPEEAWSNPLARLWYFPTTQGAAILGAFEEGDLSVPQLIGIAHEQAHLLLDFTPAKEFLRKLLAQAYTHLANIAFAEDDTWGVAHDEEWQQFQSLHARILDHFDYIALSEELIATAFGFALASFTYPSRSTEYLTLQHIEAAWVSRQSSAFRYYYPALSLIALLAANEDHSEITMRILALLGAWTQSLQRDKDGTFYMLPAEPRLDRLLRQVDTYGRWYSRTTSTDVSVDDTLLNIQHDLYRSLLKSVFKRSDEVDAWRQVIRDQEAMSRSSFAQTQHHFWAFMHSLWDVSYGTDRWPVNRAGRISQVLDVNTRFHNVLITPREFVDSWYIVPHFLLSGRTQTSQGLLYFSKQCDSDSDVAQKRARQVRRSAGFLMGFEAYREQLQMADGIRCHSFRGACNCTPEGRRATQRLSHWAREGRFGPGNWVELPPQCR
jgi:hypothetical protein